MTKEEYFYNHPQDNTVEILDKLIHDYGNHAYLSDVKDMYIRKQKMRGYKCPKCNGKGYVVTEYNAYPSGLPDSGWVYKPGYDYKECDLCNGTGYTFKQYKPKVKTEIIGYEEV